jgi:hypothetical protein
VTTSLSSMIPELERLLHARDAHPYFEYADVPDENEPEWVPNPAPRLRINHSSYLRRRANAPAPDSTLMLAATYYLDMSAVLHSIEAHPLFEYKTFTHRAEYPKDISAHLWNMYRAYCVGQVPGKVEWEFNHYFKNDGPWVITQSHTHLHCMRCKYPVKMRAIWGDIHKTIDEYRAVQPSVT